jgi:hypothetical protein
MSVDSTPTASHKDPAGAEANEATDADGRVAGDAGETTETDRPAAATAGGGLLGSLPRIPGPTWIWPVLGLAVVLAVPVWGMWRAPGQPMEEGFMLVFPERLLAGDVPNEDFLHLYGPGSLWVLAGFFQVLGADLWVERLVGLLQILGLVGGVTYTGYRWGPWPAFVGGTVTAVVIIPPTSLTALAWPGGLALALWAVILAVRSLDRDLAVGPAGGTDGAEGERQQADPDAGDGDDSGVATADLARTRRRLVLAAGLLAGAALLFRPDLVVGLGLPLGAIWLWGLDKPGRRHLLIGLGIGVSPYLVHLAMAGLGNSIRGMVLEPVFDLRPGRRLPFPPPWDGFASFLNRAVVYRNWRWPLPAPDEMHQTFLWVVLLFLVTLVLVAIAVQVRRAGRPHGWRLLALTLLCVGILPQVVQRADTAHLAWVSAVPFGLLPLALVEWWRSRDGSRRIGALLPLVPVALLFAVIPHFTLRWYADYSGRTFGYRVDSWSIENRDRTFYYGRADVAAAANHLLLDVERETEPGQRLIVGPGDFRRTPYSEAWLYFLLPQLEPGTHYIEMDPGVANAADSGLADEVRDADVVILATTYDNWDEPNTSTEDGSDEPNQVLEEEFCLHDSYGLGQNEQYPDRGFFELYLRC